MQSTTIPDPKTLFPFPQTKMVFDHETIESFCDSVRNKLDMLDAIGNFAEFSVFANLSNALFLASENCLDRLQHTKMGLSLLGSGSDDISGTLIIDGPRTNPKLSITAVKGIISVTKVNTYYTRP